MLSAFPTVIAEAQSERTRTLAKKGRKRRSRRKNKANHGKRPNAGRKH
jgi:hypothetical protein